MSIDEIIANETKEAEFFLSAAATRTSEQYEIKIFGEKRADYHNQIANIMRKYQKIEEAYKKYLNDMVTNIYADDKFIVALRGILEYGNDN